jgi:hypothetical protein
VCCLFFSYFKETKTTTKKKKTTKKRKIGRWLNTLTPPKKKTFTKITGFFLQGLEGKSYGEDNMPASLS